MVKDFAGKEINVGDLVLRVTQNSSRVVKGDVLRVAGINPVNNGVQFEGHSAYDFEGEYFAVVQKGKPMPDKIRKPYKHAEVVQAWLEGYPVEIKVNGRGWRPYAQGDDATLPYFPVVEEFRVKPVGTEKDKQIKELVRQAEELLAKAKELEATK